MPNALGHAFNRPEFQALALRKVADAKALIESGQWAAAYDACGYAIECALKASICRRKMKGGLFPDKKFSQSVFTHDLEELTRLADLVTERQHWTVKHPAFGHRWTVVARWNEQARYMVTVTESDARAIFTALTARKLGVLTWLKKYW